MSANICSRCETPVEPEDLRCAICRLPTPGNLVVPTSAKASVLRCDTCGAAVSYVVEARAPKCAFCASVMHLEEPEDPIEQAEAYLPFRVAPEQAQEALRGWLGSLGFFRPSDLQSQSRVDQLQPIWWVGWVFDAETLVSWSADSNAGSGRAGWAPHSGQSPLTLRSVLVSASRGLSLEESAQLASSFDLATAQPSPQQVGTAMIERFDVQRSAARATIARAVEQAATAQAATWIPGSSYRNLHVAVLLRRLHTRRFAFPSYILAYRYQDKLYRAIVHGQDTQCTFGDAPYSILKIIGVILGALALIALVFVIIAVTR
ncbi:MAG TPA: zinc ribbon domain-containing protein [Polyangiaceae bacterium]|nr:zinc ribbon domain-containing protein [Polyangiaceae bacterium]